jgi:hypothetical protein
MVLDFSLPLYAFQIYRPKGVFLMIVFGLTYFLAEIKT